MKTFFVTLIISLAVISAAIGAEAAEAAADAAKQPLFLLAPKSKGSHNAWSLSMIVDAADPSKPAALLLEELPGQNLGKTTYAAIEAAQKDAKTKRTEVA